MTPPEFSRTRRLDQIGGMPIEVTVEADTAERAALAARFGLLSLDVLRAAFRLHRDGDVVLATGQLSADAAQACVATGEPVPAKVAESFLLRFVPEGTPEGDEIELGAEDCDTMFYAGGAIDLGEAAAETLALALDPFPRSPEADAVLRAAGVLREEEAGPFGALAGLRDRLDKKE